jgi:hypothetical protein
MNLPLFIRRILFARSYQRRLAQLQPNGLPTTAHWLVLFDGRDPLQCDMAQLIQQQRHPMMSRCIGYESTFEGAEIYSFDKKSLFPDLRPPLDIQTTAQSVNYNFVLQLSPNPEPPLQYLAALVAAEQRIALNPSKNNDLYSVELSWEACDAPTAVQRLFNQLKTYFKHAI